MRHNSNVIFAPGTHFPRAAGEPRRGVSPMPFLPQESTALRSNHRHLVVNVMKSQVALNPSEGKIRRLLRESEDGETPQGAVFASEEAQREPAESVVFSRSVSQSTEHDFNVRRILPETTRLISNRIYVKRA